MLPTQNSNRESFNSRAFARSLKKLQRYLSENKHFLLSASALALIGYTKYMSNDNLFELNDDHLKSDHLIKPSSLEKKDTHNQALMFYSALAFMRFIYQINEHKEQYSTLPRHPKKILSLALIFSSAFLQISSIMTLYFSKLYNLSDPENYKEPDYVKYMPYIYIFSIFAPTILNKLIAPPNLQNNNQSENNNVIVGQGVNSFEIALPNNQSQLANNNVNAGQNMVTNPVPIEVQSNLASSLTNSTIRTNQLPSFVVRVSPQEVSRMSMPISFESRAESLAEARR